MHYLPAKFCGSNCHKVSRTEWGGRWMIARFYILHSAVSLFPDANTISARNAPSSTTRNLLAATSVPCKQMASSIQQRSSSRKLNGTKKKNGFTMKQTAIENVGSSALFIENEFMLLQSVIVRCDADEINIWKIMTKRVRVEVELNLRHFCPLTNVRWQILVQTDRLINLLIINEQFMHLVLLEIFVGMADNHN